MDYLMDKAPAENPETLINLVSMLTGERKRDTCNLIKGIVIGQLLTQRDEEREPA